MIAQAARISATPLCAALLALFVLLAALPAPAEAQRTLRTRVVERTQDYVIPGIQAWSVARTNGFTFRPLAAGNDQSVAQPYDGVNTRLTATVPDMRFGGLRTTRATVASVVGGNMTVARHSFTATFEMFGGRTLAPGWSVQEVTLSGSYVWDRRPGEGSDDLAFRVKSSSTANSASSVTIRSVTLRGPAGKDWQDAFVGREVYTITGIMAWATAKNYGYEFHPVPEYPDVRLYGGLDGTRSYMMQDGGGCGSISANAEVVGGNMISRCPQKMPNNYADETTDFRMFAGKTLAPGWTVREVVVTGGSWVERPAPGSNSLEFLYRLTRGGTSARVTRIVLEGPSDAPSWEDAFKVN